MKVGTVGVIPNVGGALLTDVVGRGGLVTGADCFMILVVGRLFTGYLKFCPGGVTAVDVTNGLAVLVTDAEGLAKFGTGCGPSAANREADVGDRP